MHGPCSHLKVDKASEPTVTQILSEDQSRVNSIHFRLNFNSGLQSGRDSESTLQANAGPLQVSEVTLPANSGLSLGTGTYIVVVGLGQPKSDYSLAFDTASDITWTQCQPCVVKCYDQKDKKFDPRLSTTYKNVSCNSSQCSQLTSATGNDLPCSGSTCVYGIQYADQSFSIGFFATETLTLTSTDVFPNFLFGCGQKNQGLFRGIAGLLGFGRNNLSLVSQTSSKYGEYFSYCLPTPSSSNGHLTLGKGAQCNALKLTPMTVNPKAPSFYFIEVKGIKVGGQALPISQSVFSTAGTIIDSGTFITRLPPAAYSCMRTTFRRQMKSYPMTQPFSILDTCYDISNYTTVTVPKISFIFAPHVEVSIAVEGTVVLASQSQLCLAFAGNDDASDVGFWKFSTTDFGDRV
ncbi:Nepenthesin [Bertholletia excelsa]